MSAYVYFARRNIDSYPPQVADPCKIGLTINPRGRMLNLNCRAHFALRCERGRVRRLEYLMHSRFASQRFGSVQWGPEGYTEWFWLDEEMAGLIEYVVSERKWPWNDGVLDVWCP